MAKIPNDILIAALAGYKLERQRIDEQISAVEAMLAGKAESAPVTTDGSTGKHKKRSAAVRKRMAAAQKARWAKLKGGPEAVEPALASAAPKPKRQISPEGMKRIIAATKSRWRRQKVAAKAAKKAPVKKTAAKRAAPTPAVAAAGSGQ